jgi:hypothetical protein
LISKGQVLSAKAAEGFKTAGNFNITGQKPKERGIYSPSLIFHTILLMILRFLTICDK